MTESERYKIVSNDYADLLIEYNGDISVLQNFPDSSYNIIDKQFAVLYIPEKNMTFNAVYKYGYSSIPKCYGITYTSNAELEKSYYVRNYPDMDYTGYGVLVGFVDGGIDYRNSAFQFEDNTTRIVSIWDQSIETGDYPQGFYYGTEYNREHINGLFYQRILCLLFLVLILLDKELLWQVLLLVIIIMELFMQEWLQMQNLLWLN